MTEGRAGKLTDRVVDDGERRTDGSTNRQVKKERNAGWKNKQTGR